MELKDLVRIGQRVARRMKKGDPEMDSLGALAAWKAQETYDPSRNIPIEGWVCRLTKQFVWCYFRQLMRRREEHQEAEWWWSQACGVWDEDVDTCIDGKAWQMLVEHHIDRWAMDVQARRHGLSRVKLREKLMKAEEAFLDAVLPAREGSRS